MASPAAQKTENMDAKMIWHCILCVQQSNTGSSRMGDYGTENLDHRQQHRHRP
ncbi:hypothetical protein [Sneathiella sp.]|uniref:hypothetical protein n=1 Tax=Sneathiella sp. TaxID=1964365 RepID=UPI0025D03D3D|nr:hypothetical protein [Sneathiella sp.]